MENQKGSALLIAMVAAVILTLLGLSLVLSSGQEFEVSNEFESHEQAVAIADGGFNEAKNGLRGKDLSTVLSEMQNMPKYLSYDHSVMLADAGTYASRNPLSPLEARNVDFSSTPASYGTRQVNGYLTPLLGEEFGSGRYFAKLTDNDDGDGDPFTDSDNRVMLRVMGVHMGMPVNAFAHGSNRKNSVAVVEAELRRSFSFNFSSPFSLYGKNVNPSSNKFFNGNSFQIDGYDHAGMDSADITGSHNHNSGDAGGAAVSVIYNDQGSGDAVDAANSIYNGMSSNQYDNLEGSAGLFGSEPSINDDTDFYRNNENTDLQNIFDVWFMLNFILRAASIADIAYNGDTHLAGGGVSLGTVDNPLITVVDGNLKLSGSGSGAGLLIVTGKLEYSGAFDYQGMIMVVGDGEVEFAGANKSVIGGLFAAKIDRIGTPSFGEPSFTLSGRSNFYYSSSDIAMAVSLLPLTTLSWREITPEIEPVE